MENCKAEFLYEEKKSKFFSYYFQIDVADEIEQILKNVRADNKKATHVCFAVKFAGDNFVCKCSDDGEPSGTAGRPILNVLEKQNRKNCMVVVVRYFGGIKLGAGGLVRAYTKAAAGVLGEVRDGN